MRLGRLSVAPILRGHWKGLTNGIESPTPDWVSRAVVVAAPLGTLVLSYTLEWRLQSPGSLLAAVSLLSGAMLSSFTHLSTLRMKVTEWTTHSQDRYAPERAMLDETAAHLIVAAFACMLTAILIVVGLNVRPEEQEQLTGAWASLVLAVSAWISVLFIICLPRLYSAYVQLNSVSDELSGFTRRAK